MNSFNATQSGRIDKILATELDVSRNQVEKLIKDGLVSVNTKTITKTSFKVAEGDKIAYTFKEAQKRE
ncbi:MAG TPA: RluA family pseudouridine synthase, partial [Sulfurovum sp.]|nr:RluA family pseudouridine synthase [Sulfurovum sp.]